MVDNEVAINLDKLVWTLPLTDEPSAKTASHIYAQAEKRRTIATVDNLGVVVPHPKSSHNHECFQLSTSPGKCVSIRAGADAEVRSYLGLVINGNIAQVINIPNGLVLTQQVSGDGFPWDAGKWHPSEKTFFGLSTKASFNVFSVRTLDEKVPRGQQPSEYEAVVTMPEECKAEQCTWEWLPDANGIIVSWGKTLEVIQWPKTHLHEQEGFCSFRLDWRSPPNRRRLLLGQGMRIRALATGPWQSMLCTFDAAIDFALCQVSEGSACDQGHGRLCLFWPTSEGHTSERLASPSENYVVSLLSRIPDILQVMDDLVFVGTSQTSMVSILSVSKEMLKPIMLVNLSMMTASLCRTQSLAIQIDTTREEIYVLAVLAEVQTSRSIFGNGVDKMKRAKLCCWDATSLMKEKKLVFTNKHMTPTEDTCDTLAMIVTMVASLERKVSNNLDKIEKSIRSCEERLTKIESSLCCTNVQTPSCRN